MQARRRGCCCRPPPLLQPPTHTRGEPQGHRGGAPVVDLPHARAEHDGLDPLPALVVGQPLPEGAAVASDERLAELVAIVAGAVGGIEQDLEWRGQGGWGWSWGLRAVGGRLGVAPQERVIRGYLPLSTAGAGGAQAAPRQHPSRAGTDTHGGRGSWCPRAAAGSCPSAGCRCSSPRCRRP